MKRTTQDTVKAAAQSVEPARGAAALSGYERAQWHRLNAWLDEPPPPFARWFAKAAGPTTRAVQSLIPLETLRAALDGVQLTAHRLAAREALLRDAGVGEIGDLQTAELRLCDRLADRVRMRAAMMGGGTGAAFGVAGGAGLVADVPALITLAFRTIYQTGLCYGEDTQGKEARQLATAIFALASANTEEEKQEALRATVRPQRHDLREPAWRDGLERAAERELAKEAATLSLNNLAAKLVKQLGLRKAGNLVPVIGAAVGGSVNAWYLYDVATVARYSYQSRWLHRRYPELPPPALLLGR
jgi:hypothetical protein